MEKYIDLHTHSTCSDGSMTPSQVVKHAKECGLSAISLTDHDTFAGVSEAVETGREIGVEVVPGIELSAKSDTETHILGYYVDIENPEFKSQIENIQSQRLQRNYDTLRRINECGFDITFEDGARFAGGGLVGRAHFAKAMVEKGYVSSVKEAFDNYLSNGKPCYSPMQLLTSAQCVSLINSAGGMAFVAHLHLMRKTDEQLYAFLKELKDCGLCGIEGYYTEYTVELQDKYQSLAKELGLLISGGTDFHAEMKPHISIGTGLGNMAIPYSVLENIKKQRG